MYTPGTFCSFRSSKIPKPMVALYVALRLIALCVCVGAEAVQSFTTFRLHYVLVLYITETLVYEWEDRGGHSR